MPETQSITIPAHHNIYNGMSNRELRIDFSLPSSQTNNSTGIVIFVPGFGGNIDSKVYKKMRATFADRYNLITVQCDYFGSKFMQSASSFRLQQNIDGLLAELNEDQKKMVYEDSSSLLKILSLRNITLAVSAKMNETIDLFNDMGYMQAIDIITALEAVKIILRENGLIFDDKKVIGYGHSHGAYLLHLSNRLAPHMFSHIIDNSAWIEPAYLHKNRYLFQGYGSMTLQTEFDYLAKELIIDKRALNLNTIYNEFSNVAKILTFQGTEDNLVNLSEKENLMKDIMQAEYVLVDESKVDGILFNSTKHGLDADFLNLFEWSLKKIGPHSNSLEPLIKYEIHLSKSKIKVDYTYGLPVFEIEFC